MLGEIDTAAREEKAKQLAAEIMSLARSTLTVDFRFLDRALGTLKFVPNENVSLTTDGEFLYYGAWFILSRYKTGAGVVSRDILHSLLHCVFRHFSMGDSIDRARWDLACDIAVEAAINDLNSRALSAPRQSRQKLTLETIKNDVPVLTAERIYHWLGKNGISDDECEAERELFLADGHGLWYGAKDKDARLDKNINVRKVWEKLSKRMQTELETMRDDKNGAMVQALRSLNRPKYSYTELLRRFGVHGEQMKISDEEFDNNYYTYGLSFYGNMPLIEPLEYTEQKLIREFVIAIDTSGSVRGDVVQSFIQHTHDMLQKQENFFTRVNIHIIQCDDRVREDAVITCKEDFDEYMSQMEILGLEGTDFRPVFQYVEELRAKGELKNLQGLIYFTDGDGEFPSKKPPYDVAFILHCEDYAQPEVPSWAISITLTEDEILEKRF